MKNRLKKAIAYAIIFFYSKFNKSTKPISKYNFLLKKVPSLMGWNPSPNRIPLHNNIKSYDNLLSAIDKYLSDQNNKGVS